MSDHQLKMMSCIIRKMKLSSIILVILSVELNVLKQAEIKKTKNDQSYFFYIHIKILVFVGIGFIFTFEKKKVEKLKLIIFEWHLNYLYILCCYRSLLILGRPVFVGNVRVNYLSYLDLKNKCIQDKLLDYNYM